MMHKDLSMLYNCYIKLFICVKTWCAQLILKSVTSTYYLIIIAYW